MDFVLVTIDDWYPTYVYCDECYDLDIELLFIYIYLKCLPLCHHLVDLGCTTDLINKYISSVSSSVSSCALVCVKKHKQVATLLIYDIHQFTYFLTFITSVNF